MLRCVQAKRAEAEAKKAKEGGGSSSAALKELEAKLAAKEAELGKAAAEKAELEKMVQALEDEGTPYPVRGWG